MGVWVQILCPPPSPLPTFSRVSSHGKHAPPRKSKLEKRKLKTRNAASVLHIKQLDEVAAKGSWPTTTFVWC